MRAYADQISERDTFDAKASDVDPTTVTHYVPYELFERRVAYALCGRPVHPVTEHDADPTCPICRARLAEQEGMEL